MTCGTGGYLGLVRLEDDRLDLAAAFDADWMRRAGGPGAAAKALLSEAGWPAPFDLLKSTWRGTPALTRQARRLAAERVFVLGDAAGYVEPFTGEGMAWALAAGVAVAPLAASSGLGMAARVDARVDRLLSPVVSRRQTALPRRRRCSALLLSSPALSSPFWRAFPRWPRPSSAT